MSSRFDMLHRKGRIKALIALAGMMVGLVALTAAIHAALDHRPGVEEASPAAATPEASGQTPNGNVIAPPAILPPRTLDDALRQKISQEVVDKNAAVIVMCQHGDQETENYAHEIFAFLQAQGYANARFEFVGILSAFRGVDIQVQTDKAFIRVGPRD